MSTHQPHGPRDDRFSRAYTALVADLATVLDLTVGADEATHPGIYATLTTDLATALQLDAGLDAIIGSPPTPAPAAGDSTSATNSTHQGRPVADLLGSLTDPERLCLRARASYRGLRWVLALVANLDRARDVDLARALNHARDLARDHGLDHVRDDARALTQALDDALGYARALAHNRARGRRRAADHSARGRILARHRARALTRALTRARALARNLADDLDLDFARDLVDDLDRKWITSVLEELTELADNFVGANLRAAVDFDSTGWEGVRWSPATSWPPGWAERVRAISVEIAPGVFEVLRDSRHSHSLHEVGT